MRNNEFHGKGSIRYNGSERICSRLGDNVKPIAATGNGRLAYRTELADWLSRSELQELVSIYGYNAGTPATGVNVLISTGSPNDIYYYSTNHLGSTAFVTDNNATITQGFLYAPFGEITTEYNATFGNDIIPKYSFNAKELDEETGMYYYEARYYKPPVFTSRDPMFEKYFWMNPYTYCANNPVKYVDPSGEELDEPQRRAAIAKAKEYEMANRVDKSKPSGKGNSQNTYKLGAKGKPGEQVDCSGLTSNCIMAGGEPNPVLLGTGGGVKRTAEATTKVENNDAEPGNLAIFNNQGHIGIITEVYRDNDGNVTGFQMIHSSGKPERGYSGPNITDVVIGEGYWGQLFDGFYKWDTKPDSQTKNDLLPSLNIEIPVMLPDKTRVSLPILP